MKYQFDKQGRSVKQLALLKWFVRQSYEGLPDDAIDQYAVKLYDEMEEREEESE